MITKLVITDKASYDHQGIKFDNATNDLGRLNIIYGANGSGKSTLVSEIYRHSQNQGQLDRNVIIWKDKDKEELLIFDEKFIQNHFIDHRNQLDGITYGLIDQNSQEWHDIENNLREITQLKHNSEGMLLGSCSNTNYSKYTQQVLFDESASMEILDYYKSKGKMSLYDFFKFEYDLFIKKEEAHKEDIDKYLNNYLSSNADNANPFFVKLVNYNKKIISVSPKLFYVTIPCFILHYFLIEQHPIPNENTKLSDCRNFFTDNFDENKFNSILDEYTKKRIDNIELLEIVETRKKIRDVSEVVEKINTQLRYYNYTSFYIEAFTSEKDIIPHFKLKRKGVKDTNVFDSLSEAEKHFIAFLYFYHWCLGYKRSFENIIKNKKKVIIFDDPVTSMDSNTLFVVSQMLCDLFRRADNDKNLFSNDHISQGFVLTHNSYFFKEFDYRRKNKCVSDQKIFRLYRELKGDKYVSQLESRYTYKDDYTLMWNNLKAIKSQGNQDKSMNVIIGNLCRRILESYGKFIGYINDDDNSLSTLLPNLKAEGVTISPHEEILFNAFIAMINTDSHYFSSSEDTYYQAVSDISTSQIFDVFEQIFKKIGPKHYELRMK